MTLARVAPLVFLATAACVAVPPETPQPEPDTAPESVASAESPVVVSLPPVPAIPPPAPARLEGKFEQGGWIRGIVPEGVVSATVDGEQLEYEPETRAFFVGLDRDADAAITFAFTGRDGQIRSQRRTIAPREWDIEHVNVARRPSKSSEAFRQRRSVELEAIWSARAERTRAHGWRQDFVWPVTGRISGRFGSQRIYRGEAASYHSGLDIAGSAGTTYVAPADGVVVLAETDFSLEGQLLIIDHGQGLNSAFLHSSALLVREGQVVRQGQPLGRIGSSGRATGPHLHWSLVWKDKRLDPLLFLPPMP